MVNVPEFKKKCEDILDYFHNDDDLNWNLHSPSLHVLLHHGAEIIDFFQSTTGFPASYMSEEGMYQSLNRKKCNIIRQKILIFNSRV